VALVLPVRHPPSELLCEADCKRICKRKPWNRPLPDSMATVSRGRVHARPRTGQHQGTRVVMRLGGHDVRGREVRARVLACKRRGSRQTGSRMGPESCTAGHGDRRSRTCAAPPLPDCRWHLATALEAPFSCSCCPCASAAILSGLPPLLTVALDQGCLIARPEQFQALGGSCKRARCSRRPT
jgi:hypothetical protein